MTFFNFSISDLIFSNSFSIFTLYTSKSSSLRNAILFLDCCSFFLSLLFIYSPYNPYINSFIFLSTSSILLANFSFFASSSILSTFVNCNLVNLLFNSSKFINFFLLSLFWLSLPSSLSLFSISSISISPNKNFNFLLISDI